MYSMREFTEKTGFSKGSLAHLEGRGILNPERNNKNHRVYTDYDIIRILDFAKFKGAAIKRDLKGAK